jgi:hypothetical protein
MVTQAEFSTRRFTLPGFLLALIGGAVAAAAAGYAYFFIAIELGFDVIIVIAALLGAAVGWIVGLAARIGRFRSSFMLILLGFLFGVASYGGRYYFEFNDFVAYVVEEETTRGVSADETRQEFLEFWAEEYPPGGFLGYFTYVAETGFLLGDDLQFDPDTLTTTQGTQTEGFMVWLLFGLEALFAGILAAGMARSTAISR